MSQHRTGHFTERRKEALLQTIAEQENIWLARSYLVLVVLTPVTSTCKDKIEFPGNPFAVNQGKVTGTFMDLGCYYLQ